MKKALCFLAAVLLLSALTACGESQATVPTEVPTTKVLNYMPDGSVIEGELPADYFANTVTQGTVFEPTSGVGQSVETSDTPTAVQNPTAEAPVAVTQTEQIIAIYNDVYNKTKAGGTFTGSDAIVISDITIDGEKNSAVDKVVHSVMDAVYKPQTLPLPPYSEENPFDVCIFTAEDAQSAEWKDLGNGQAEITVTPKPSVNSTLGNGQGKMFNVVNDIGFIFDYMPDFAFGWSEGDIDSNVIATYDGGYCRVVYDCESMQIVSAEYVMKLCIEINNMEVLFSSHDISVNMTYTQTFPATA